MDFWQGLQCQTWIPSCEAGLKYKQKQLVTHSNHNATIAPVGTSCLSGQDCSLQSSRLGKVVVDLHSPSSLYSIFLYSEPIHPERGFHISSSLIFYILPPKYIVSSPTVFPSTSGWQPRTMAMWCVVWGAGGFEDFLTHGLVYHIWHWDFHLIICGFWEQHLPLIKDTFIQTF